MKLAITGASGNVGQGVIQEALEHTNHQLRLIDVREPSNIIDDARVEYVTADLRDYHTFYDALDGTDALIHLAVGGFKGPPPFESQDVHNSMVVMSYNALQGTYLSLRSQVQMTEFGIVAAANLGMRHVVLASSINAVGALFSADPKYEYFPLDEKHPYNPEDGYSVGQVYSPRTRVL